MHTRTSTGTSNIISDLALTVLFRHVCVRVIIVHDALNY